MSLATNDNYSQQLGSRAKSQIGNEVDWLFPESKSVYSDIVQ